MQIVIAAFSLSYGDYYRLIYGVDSYGNTCGRKNTPIANQSLSGEDLRSKPFVPSLFLITRHHLLTILHVQISVRNGHNTSHELNVDMRCVVSASTNCRQMGAIPIGKAGSTQVLLVRCRSE